MALWWLAQLGLVVLSQVPAAAPPAAFHTDKLLHLAVFMALTMVPLLIPADRPQRVVALALVPMLTGIGIEALQYVNPGRSFSLGDLAANTLGAALGLAMGLMLRRTALYRRFSAAAARW